MDLFKVRCVRLLLDACVESLETLRLYPTDQYGEEFVLKGKQKRMNSSPQFIANDQAVRLDFDLSRNKRLKTLETTAESITAAGDVASGFLKAVLSTIASPLPLDVVVTYRDNDIDYCIYYFPKGKPVRVKYAPQKERATVALRHPERFKVFSEMHRMREFRLVLCVDVLDCIAEYAVGVLERIVEEERMNGRLDFLLCEPLIISEIRSPRTRFSDDNSGCMRGGFIRANAL